MMSKGLRHHFIATFHKFITLLIKFEFVAMQLNTDFKNILTK